MNPDQLDETLRAVEVVQIEGQRVTRRDRGGHQVRSALARLTACSANRRADLAIEPCRVMVIREWLEGRFHMLQDGVVQELKAESREPV